MTDPTDNIDSDEAEQRRKKKGEGEGEQAGSGVAKMLTTRKAEQVKGEHVHLTGEALVEAFVEFFSETLRASANLVVTFVDRAKQTVNVNPHAIITSAIEGAKVMIRELARTRERVRGAGRDSRGFQQRSKPGSKGLGITPGPAGPRQ